MSYYREIDGKKYDRKLLELADEVTTGRGEHRISKDEAKQLYEAVADGDSYTDVEKDTVKYIRENYEWTDAANEWFRAEIRKWAAAK